MPVTRVWNITDSGKKGVTSHNRMVLGEVVKPGKSMRVDEDRLVGATKLHQDVSANLLFIGKRPPDWYAKMKKPPRAVADARIVNDKGEMLGKKVAVAKGHERLPAEAMAADVAGKIEEAAPEAATEEAAAEPVEVPAESEATEESSEDDGSSRRSRRGRRR